MLRLRRRTIVRLAAFRVIVLLLSVRALAAIAAPPELALPSMTRLADDVFVAQVAPGLWVHTTLHTLSDGTVFPANGMLLETPRGSVIVDTGWNDAQARVLLDWAGRKLGKSVLEAIVTHAHEDRTGGAAVFAKAGIPVVATPRTEELEAAKGSPVAFRVLPSLTRREKVRDPLGPVLLFPGPGHAPDNLVVYFPKQEVLFGGCLLKAASAEGLGNTVGASLQEWPHSVAAVRRAFLEARLVVPGHGAIGGDPFGRTLALLKTAAR